MATRCSGKTRKGTVQGRGDQCHGRTRQWHAWQIFCKCWRNCSLLWLINFVYHVNFINCLYFFFQFLFHQPMRVVNWLLILTWLLVGYQFFCLIQSTEWNHIVCIALVLFCNYYTLFKLLRDRIILAKAYKEELSEDDR